MPVSCSLLMQLCLMKLLCAAATLKWYTALCDATVWPVSVPAPAPLVCLYLRLCLSLRLCLLLARLKAGKALSAACLSVPASVSCFSQGKTLLCITHALHFWQPFLCPLLWDVARYPRRAPEKFYVGSVLHLNDLARRLNSHESRLLIDVAFDLSMM